MSRLPANNLFPWKTVSLGLLLVGALLVPVITRPAPANAARPIPWSEIGAKANRGLSMRYGNLAKGQQDKQSGPKRNSPIRHKRGAKAGGTPDLIQAEPNRSLVAAQPIIANEPLVTLPRALQFLPNGQHGPPVVQLELAFTLNCAGCLLHLHDHLTRTRFSTSGLPAFPQQNSLIHLKSNHS